ncbi:MAG: hypothetical protein KJ578_07135 [Bacteroidetes bacterium]|nr:hypothetical protein [Bacteroidota bacterium]
MTNHAADGKRKKPNKLFLCRSYGALGYLRSLYHTAVPTELAFMLIRKSKRMQQQFFNIQYPYRSDTMTKKPRRGDTMVAS